MRSLATIAFVSTLLALCPGKAGAQASFVVGSSPAVTKADGPCYDNQNRFVDCGNGTITDTLTGLVWLRQAACDDLPGMGGTNFGDWRTAMQSADALEHGLCGLSDGSEPGDWRLPAQHEWFETLRDPVYLGCTGAGAPAWTDDAGIACVSSSVTSFSGISAVSYWSSTLDASLTGFVDVANLSSGLTDGNLAKFANAGFWAVRGPRAEIF